MLSVALFSGDGGSQGMAQASAVSLAATRRALREGRALGILATTAGGWQRITAEESSITTQMR